MPLLFRLLLAVRLLPGVLMFQSVSVLVLLCVPVPVSVVGMARSRVAPVVHSLFHSSVEGQPRHLFFRLLLPLSRELGRPERVQATMPADVLDGRVDLPFQLRDVSEITSR